MLTIVDVDRGKKEREITVEGVDEVPNPTWSPDGNTIAFSGLVGGFTDLFVYDLNGEPAEAADHRSVRGARSGLVARRQDAGVQHRSLHDQPADAGGRRPAAGGARRRVGQPSSPPAASSRPRTSARSGRPTARRSTSSPIAAASPTSTALEIGGATTQLTNLLTGASGITELSPALSVADGRRGLQRLRRRRLHDLRARDGRSSSPGADVQDLPINAAVLPPRKAGAGPVYAALTNETLGLPPESAAAVPAEEYKPKLGLDFAASRDRRRRRIRSAPTPPAACRSCSATCSAITRSTPARRSTSRFDEFGGNVIYINRTHRWNWGVALDQTPYVYRTFDAGVAFPQGVPIYVEQEYRILQVDRSLTGLLSYPFSRAQRIEFSGGARQIGFKQDLTTRLYDYQSGQQLSEDEESLSDEPNLNLGEASAALVYDTSINGITSPIRGSRYRLEVSQTGGSLTFTGLTSDFRTYLMPVRPFTFAFRGLFYGRYGTDAEDFRLPTLYLGYPGLVRGYD